MANSGHSGGDGGFDDAWSELLEASEAKDGPSAPAKRSKTMLWTEESRGEAKRRTGSEDDAAGPSEEPVEPEPPTSQTLNWTDQARSEPLAERPKLDFNPIGSVQASVKSAWAEEVPDDAPVKSEMTTAELDAVDEDSSDDATGVEAPKGGRPSSDLKTSKAEDEEVGASTATASGIFDVFVPPSEPTTNDEREMDRVMGEVAFAEPVKNDDAIPEASPAASKSDMLLPWPETLRAPDDEMARVMSEGGKASARRGEDTEASAATSESESERDSEDDEVAKAQPEPKEDANAKDEVEADAEPDSDASGASQTGRRPKPSETVSERKPASHEPEPAANSGRIWWATAAIAAGVAFVVINRSEPDPPEPPAVAQSRVQSPPDASPKAKASPSIDPARLAPGPQDPNPNPTPEAGPNPTPSPNPEANPNPAPSIDPARLAPGPQGPNPTIDPARLAPGPQGPNAEPEPEAAPASADPRAVPPGTSPEAAAAFVRLPVSAADKAPVGGVGLSGIHIDDISLGDSYGRGRCEGGQGRFSLARHDRVNVCMRVVHPREEERVAVYWEQDGGTVRRSGAAIRPTHAYRTRAFLQLRSEYVGQWRVRVLSEDGVELASRRFEVVE